MGKKIFISIFWTFNVFAGGGNLLIHNHSKEPVIIRCSIVSITGKEISTEARVSRHHESPLNWPSIQDLFPRETLRGIVFHIKIDLYDERHHLLNRSQITHIFHRNPNDYETQEVYADLSVDVTEDGRIHTYVGKSR